jgi:hypothetical protein
VTTVRALRAPAAGLLVALALPLAGGSAPAAAAPARPSCTLKLASKDAVVAAAAKVDAVFVAKVRSVDPHPGPPGGSVATVHAQVVLGLQGQPRKGGPAVLELGPGASTPPRAGTTYLFFAKRDGAGFDVDLCGGAVWLRKGLTSSLRDRLRTDLQGSESGVQVTLAPPSGDAHDLPALSRVAAPGAGIALFGVLGLLLVRRLGRERF